MKRNLYAILLLCLAILLAGCGQDTDHTESELWSPIPQLTYGVMEYEALSELPWYSGRMEALSRNCMAETANGYYCTNSGRLFYADKERPEVWSPVCSKPNCDHLSLMTCDAIRLLQPFIVRDGRMYFEELAGVNPHLYNKAESDFILVSTLPDGTDKKFAYAIEDDQLVSYNGGSSSFLLTANMWLYTDANFESDGSYTIRVYKVDEEGQHQLLEEVSETSNTSCGWPGGLYGDPYYQVSALSTESALYFGEDEIKELKLSSIPDHGGYISGDIFRYFVPNEGYFDRNIQTGEEIKLAPAQMENSIAYIPLPNCMIESTLFVPEGQFVPDGHTMRLYNGKKWHTVTLPEELRNAQDVALTLESITSDSILISRIQSVTEVHNSKEYYYDDMVLYRIAIGGNRWNLEYFGTIQQPRDYPASGN